MKIINRKCGMGIEKKERQTSYIRLRLCKILNNICVCNTSTKSKTDTVLVVLGHIEMYNAVSRGPCAMDLPCWDILE